jgi:putative ATP-dependent endonuclease of the OLD family
MTKIIQLGIKNYRGIKDLSLSFSPNQNLFCLIGRGDSGKTTVLEAISSVLSPNWNLSFYDTDFYDCNVNNDIEISASLIGFPDSYLSDNKFGLYIRGFDTKTQKIIDDVISNNFPDEIIPVLTIKLIIDKSLEPQWVVSNNRDQEDKPISSADRGHLNCYLISDYVDSHFSWNKGNPLYALLKSTASVDESQNNNIIIECLRDAKKEIDKMDFAHLDEATNLVKEGAQILGLNISNIRTTLDSRELSIKDGRISLHESSIPFRLKGKGAKRLASIAIQATTVQSGGIMLIDEIEQGQEPDRIIQIARSLKENSVGQIFISTHSREVICELGAEPLLLLLKNEFNDEIIANQLTIDDEKLQSTVRACPEAFFAQKVIICEGATEVGICRALDGWRKSKHKPPMSFQNCAYVDGNGKNLIFRVNAINSAGFKTALLCDSDPSEVNDFKSSWKNNGVAIFDCESDLCLERQVFQDLPWITILELIDYVIKVHKKTEESLLDSLKEKFSDKKRFPENWKISDTPEMREALAKASLVKEKEWFKSIYHGEALGDIIFKYFDNIEPTTHFKKMLMALSTWVDS